MASLVVACSTPTELCGCSIARAAVVVKGTLHTEAGEPVPGVQVNFDGVPATMSADPPMALDHPATTDAQGAFTTLAFSVFGSAEQTIRAVVIGAPHADTLRLRTGAMGAFREGSATLDTVRLALRIP